MKPRLLLIILTLAAMSLACYMPIPNAPGQGTGTPSGLPSDTPNALTAVALTVSADLTATPREQAQVTTSSTTVATWTVGPSPTDAPPTFTRVPPTVTPQPCDQFGFIQDVTIPDGAKVPAGSTFTKTWRLRNLGTCAWNTNYALVFFGGDPLGAPTAVNLKGDVYPNGVVDVSVDMRAPAKPGSYISYWKMRNPQGVLFTLPEGQSIFTQIEVVATTLTPTVTMTATVTPTPTITPTGVITPTRTLTPPSTSGVIQDYTANMCNGVWRTAAGTLTCPGTTADPGYVMKLENPRLETGANEPNPVLITVPQNVENGVITGTFPAMTIQQGYHFRATLGCLDGATSCDVRYQLNYTIGATTNNLGQWDQRYDGSIQGIDVDLSALAGQTVELSLVTLANGPATGDQALWIYPRIVKQQ